MTVRNLFSMILKVLGIFFIKDIVASIVQVLSFVFIVGKQFGGAEMLFKEFLVLVIITIVYGLVSWLLIFNTDALISILKIEAGFDDPVIPLNMHRSTILSIAVMVIGGYMVVDELPMLCRQVFVFYQQKNEISSLDPRVNNMIFSVVKILIGLMLLGFQRPIVNMIERGRKKAAHTDAEQTTGEL